MAREAMDGMFASTKGKQQKQVRPLQCQEQYIDPLFQEAIIFIVVREFSYKGARIAAFTPSCFHHHGDNICAKKIFPPPIPLCHLSGDLLSVYNLFVAQFSELLNLLYFTQIPQIDITKNPTGGSKTRWLFKIVADEVKDVSNTLWRRTIIFDHYKQLLHARL